MYTTAELKQLADIDRELAYVLANRPWSSWFQWKTMSALLQFPSMDGYLIGRLRGFIAAGSANQPTTDGVVEKDVMYGTRDGVNLRLRVFQPSSISRPAPLIVLYHGGGWIMGQPENMARLANRLVIEFGAVCIAPQYRLAPEHPFPTGINDTYDALKWIATHASELGADPAAGFIVGGQSAGGHASAVASLLARDGSLLPPLTGIYLAAPSLLPADRVPTDIEERYISRSQEECLNDPLSPAAMRRLFKDAAKIDTADPRAAPYLWASGHEALPPTYIQVCGLDVNRDEALLYDELLRKNGVATRMDVYKGLSHVWWSTIPQLKSSRKWLEDTVAGIAWLLKKPNDARL